MILFMENILNVSKLLISGVVVSSFLGCNSVSNPTPTTNEALNNVSNSNAGKEEKGLMQKSLDGWMKSDWDKNTKDFKKEQTQKKDELHVEEENTKSPSKKKIASQKQNVKNKEDTRFLQHYVNKMEYHNKHTKEDKTPSHVEELNKLPAIGK